MHRHFFLALHKSCIFTPEMMSIRCRNVARIILAECTFTFHPTCFAKQSSGHKVESGRVETTRLKNLQDKIDDRCVLCSWIFALLSFAWLRVSLWQTTRRRFHLYHAKMSSLKAASKSQSRRKQCTPVTSCEPPCWRALPWYTLV